MARRGKGRKPAERQVIAVEGYREFKRDLGKVSKDLKNELKRANQRLGDEVEKRAKARARSIGGVAAKSVPAIKSKATLQAARIILDGKTYPYALGAEFGAHISRVYGRPVANQGANYGRAGEAHPWTGNRYTAEPKDIGYFLHPTIYDAVRDRTLLTVYEEELARIDRRAFPDKHRSP